MTTDSESFRRFVAGLRPAPLTDRRADPYVVELAARSADLTSMPEVSAGTLSALLRQDPGWLRVFGLALGWSQETLTSELTAQFGTASAKAMRTRAEAVVEYLDARGLSARVSADRRRTWHYGDILAERYSSRTRAQRAIGSGRALEDAVEAVVENLGLPFEMRTTFVGRVQSAPCDLAIPRGGAEALIACAIKGFDSTGSKLTDAAREVEAMALARRPAQYVFAVFDGIGWLRRRADLRRVWQLAEDRHVDGLFNGSTLPAFGVELEHAALRVGLLPGS